MNIRLLSTELKEVAEKELNEDSQRVEDDLSHIKDWFTKQPHLKAITDDQWLIAFLRGCKFSLQRTKDKIDYFYTMRTLMPEFFENRNPFLPFMQNIIKAGAILTLPKALAVGGPRILIIIWRRINFEKTTAVDVLKAIFMTLDILLNEDDNFTISGLHMFADLKYLPTNYLLQFTPDLMKKSILLIQQAYPVRVKGIHCVNCPPAFETVFNIVKTVSSKKLLSRFTVLSESNFENIYHKIPQIYLPTEYGGENGCIDELQGGWQRKVESYKQWFLDDMKYYSNENLRFGKPKTSSEEFGIEGSFRKLLLD